jgi:hypothetical protein
LIKLKSIHKNLYLMDQKKYSSIQTLLYILFNILLKINKILYFQYNYLK